jgi:hypothetical protein
MPSKVRMYPANGESAHSIAPVHRLFFVQSAPRMHQLNLCQQSTYELIF